MAAPQIAFLGTGNLASAIVRGLLANKVCAPADLAGTSKTGASAQKLAAETGLTFEPDLAKLLGAADTVVVAFKPQSLASADARLADLTRGKLVISVLAGKRLARLAQVFPHARNLVRFLPNTPSAIGAGITGWCAASPLSPADHAIVRSVLDAIGVAVEVAEPHLDAITALGGSGPAFLFEFVAALREGGLAAGLPPDVARRFATETVLGAARLLARSGADPETLRAQVTSPNGTTHAGLQVMAAANFRATMRDTILAATRRAEELAKD
ncbi:MAG: pyrroline-5-carboxylate reductase [Opitutae bacterium]|nr:pyrroline-5-carboxylate reductase [Opitutae bacterium]